jgi:hypothetical protein
VSRANQARKNAAYVQILVLQKKKEVYCLYIDHLGEMTFWSIMKSETENFIKVGLEDYQ